LRFLNIKVIIPEKKIDTVIELKPGENTIQTDAEYLKGIIPELPVIGIYGRGSRVLQPSDILESDNYSIAIEADFSGKQISLTNKNGALTKDHITTDLLSCDDFLLYSFFSPAIQESYSDPVLKSSVLKKFLLNREMSIEKSGSMHNLEAVIAEKEKEINSLKKNRELLELKKRKKDKLNKELSSFDRELGKLRRKKESYTAYKNTLTEILDLIQEDARLSSKIVNLKKDIIDIRETAGKREDLEREISERFPQFTRGMIERLPDLDRLQAEFNAIRDINEEMEKFNFRQKKKISLALKGITGGLLFAFSSMIFIFIKSIHLNTVTGMVLAALSSVLVMLSAVTGYYLFLQIRKNYPEELLDRKKKIESGLLEIFTNDNFPERNFATGELYEYLFQYFEDFLSFRDLQNELTLIKKGSGSRTSLEEREEKLQNLSGRKNEIQQEIETKLNSLDVSIHPAPDRENIKSLIPEINEMIDEIAQEEESKESIAQKIGHETKQYESGDKSRQSIDESIGVIDADIEKLKKDVSDISFMHKVYNESSEEWFQEKFSVIAERCAVVYSSLLNDSKKNLKVQDSIRELILNEKRESFTAEETAAFAFSMKMAIADTAPPSENYPLILADPFSVFKPEIADKLKKLLLELSEKRQVVIIISKSEKNLAGNLINI
jgi:DNA repair exonuclease SbcCD ATPase subunit